MSLSALAPARAPTVQTRHKPGPWTGAAGSSRQHKPPSPGPLPGLARSGVTKMAGRGEDRCEVTQGQSSVSPDPWRLLQSRSRGAQVLNFRAGMRALHTCVCMCVHPHALPESSRKEQLHDQPAGRISQKRQNPRGGAESEARSPHASITAYLARMRPGLRAPSPTGRSPVRRFKYNTVYT